jgi:hypothetical protein
VNSDHIKSTLQESIQHFRDINPDKHSYAYIGMKSNNSTSFVERAAKNKLGVPLDPKKVLPLANLVCDEPQTRQVAKFFADNLVEQSDILKDALYAKFVQENDRYVSQELERLFQNKNDYIAYVLSSKELGVSEEEVLTIGGSSLVNSLKNLTNKGFIQKINNNYKSIKSSFSYSFVTMKRLINHLSEYYNPNNVGKERNYVHVVTTSLTKEGIKELQEEHRRHHNKIREIKMKHKGNISTFSVGFMDTFSEDTSETNSKTIKSLIVGLCMFSTLLIQDHAIAKESYLENSISKLNINSIQKVIIETSIDKDSLYIREVVLKDGSTFSHQDLQDDDYFKIRNFIEHNTSLGKFTDPGGDGGGGKVLDPLLTGDSPVSPIIIEYPYEQVEVNLDALNYPNQQNDVIFDFDDLLSDY